MHSSRTKLVATALAIATVYGCGTTPEATNVDSAAITDRSSGTDSASTQGVSPGTTFEGDPLNDPSSLLATRTVYFDFDSAELKGPDRAVMEAHASYLAERPSVQVTLEGHADERGTREYNIALGERRANGARQFMTALGASGQQVRTISYGEERPAAKGHGEASWRLNRRVDIVYSK